MQALERDIRAWVAAWNDNPIPFVWTKAAEQILQSIQRLMKRINGAGPLGHDSQTYPSGSESVDRPLRAARDRLIVSRSVPPQARRVSCSGC